MAIVPASNRFRLVTTADTGNLLEIGPASTPSSVGTWIIEFDPSLDFAGSFQVMGRVTGPEKTAGNSPIVPVPYRKINVGGVASDYSIAADTITAVGIIQVPSNGLSISLLAQVGTGSCKIYSWDLQGPSAV